MDPQATLEAWLQADNSEDKQELAEAYNGWRASGGFPATLAVGHRVNTLDYDGANSLTVLPLGSVA